MTPAQFLAARRRLGLTQAQMGAALGVTTRAVQFWEAGGHAISGPVARLVERLAGDLIGKRPIDKKTK